MTSARRISLSSLAILAFAAAIWASPSTNGNFNDRPSLARQQGQTEIRSVSGKIASVQKDVGPPYKDSFTLDVEDSPTPLTFFTYKGTTVEGSLKAGAFAEITYAMDTDGNDVAVKVHITH